MSEPEHLDVRKPQLQSILTGLRAQKATVAAAESCTGGLVTALLTELPGSSEVCRGGVVAYDPALKTALLGVSAELIAAAGVVSAAVAEAMAKGARQRLGVDYAVATTGIAGPTGGTPEAPVGTVWCGYAGPKGSFAKCLSLTGSREAIRQAAAQAVIGELAMLINK